MTELVNMHVDMSTALRSRFFDGPPDCPAFAMLEVGSGPWAFLYFHDRRQVLDLAYDLIELHREWTEAEAAKVDTDGADDEIEAGGDDLPPW